MTISSVTIVGLGLIGGSFAKAIREKLPYVSITAVDPNTDSLSAAKAEGVISHAVAKLDKTVCSSDLVLLCVPIDHMADTIETIAHLCAEHTIVADTASVNALPVNTAEQISRHFRFVSTHPMAGGEKGGYEEAKHYLFENAYVILSPSLKSDEDAIKQVEAFYKALGAITVVLPASDHDYAAGVISHVPHIVASALVNLLAVEDDGEKTMQSFAAGGFKDITRIASSSPTMWTSISTLNQNSVLKIIDKYIQILSDFKQNLATGQTEYLHDFFAQAKKLRDTVVSTAPKAKYIQQLYEIYADVEDRVGAILIVAEMLSRENVSIKNINVKNAREEDEGVLSIAFATQEDAVKAVEVLNRNGVRAGIKG